MKKLLISLLTGAVLIGIGAGVMFFEISEFTFSNFNTTLKNEPQQVYTLKSPKSFNENNGEINVNGYLGRYFNEQGEYSVKADNTLAENAVEVDIYYRGQEPDIYMDFYFESYYDNEKEEYIKDKSSKVCRISTYRHSMTPKQFFEALAYMSKNKIFIDSFENFIVDKIVIRTSNPELIDVNF